MNEWGKLETLLRKSKNKTKAISILKTLFEWDFSQYIEYNLENFIPSWICPGCSWEIEGDEWSMERTKHRRKCHYYQNTSSRSYCHETSRCICCILPYHLSSGKKSRAMDVLNSPKKISKKKKKKKVSLYTCAGCKRTVSDVPASRWQHRQRNPSCKKFYLKQKQRK